jgi:hypothetical protein
MRINKKRTESKTKDDVVRDREDKRGSSKINKKKRSVSKRVNSSSHYNINI